MILVVAHYVYWGSDTMNNVYALVEHFYEKNIDAEDIVSQEAVERYLRRQAWQGTNDEDLKTIWAVISILILSVDQMNLYSLGSLTAYDYQEIFYRYAQDNKSFVLEEEPINRFLSIVESFFAYLAEFDEEEDYRPYLVEVRHALYDNGTFFLPPRRSKDEFYSSLEHMLEVSPEALQQLNQLLDSLLHRIESFYREQTFKEDMDRAILMYIGPEYDGGALEDEENALHIMRSFWIGFWDFFLFDYHLLDSDTVPLRYYYEHKKAELNSSEQDILRDLLRSEFTVFSITSFNEDYVTCQNLFTEEYMDLPVPEIGDASVEDSLLYGHVHKTGVMLLNYITSIPASSKLKQRMKELVMRQYDLFRFQLPEAALKDFFAREAGAVRHTLQILSGFAQLNMLPVRSIAKPIPKNQRLADEYGHEELMLRHFGRQFGYSKFELTLLLKLFEDYLEVLAEPYDKDKIYAIMTAAVLKFSQINGTDLTTLPDMYNFMGAKKEETIDHMKAMKEKLGCVLYDPRYLTEDGFIRALYD